MICEVHGVARAGKLNVIGTQAVLIVDQPDTILLRKESPHDAVLTSAQARALAAQLIAAAKRLDARKKK